MPRRTALIVGSYFIFNDPPSRNTSLSLVRNGWDVELLTHDFRRTLPHQTIECVPATFSPVVSLPGKLGRLNGVLQSILYGRAIRHAVARLQPLLVLTMHLYDLAALPWPPKKYGYRLVSALLDIPAIEDAGWHDRVVLRRAWGRIGQASVVWASDTCKAALTRKFGCLEQSPLVCHNAPPTDYLPEPLWPRDPWLRHELRRMGATIGDAGGCIVLRSGAVGEWGGLDETLDALARLPNDVVFLMMGRPLSEYSRYLVRRISERNLGQRCFLWDRPSDEVWLKALRGADVGHLIHGPYPPGRWQRQYEHNSSLSNNRLFQYMAAGLPILGYDDPRLNDLYAEVPCFKVARLDHLKDDLTAQIQELAADPGLREQLGRIGRAAHFCNYNWTAQFAPVLNWIESLFP